MKILTDTHNHTISSGHAYSTIKEIAEEAAEKGLKIIAMTDHGPSMPGGPHIFHIGNQRVLPDYIHGVRVLKGVEANIIDYEGGLDMALSYLKRLDIVIAGFHDVCIAPGSVEENTAAILGAMRNPFVDIIAHPGNPAFPIDIDSVVDCAVETGTLIEINNSSFKGSRKGSTENCREIALACKKRNALLAIGSDSHVCFDVGRFDNVLKLFSELSIQEELVISTSPQRLVDYLNSKGRKIAYEADAHENNKSAIPVV